LEQLLSLRLKQEWGSLFPRLPDDCVYFDNAAMTRMPSLVIEKLA
jgi:selenocysteine lyase/cysteine desulfurase